MSSTLSTLGHFSSSPSSISLGTRNNTLISSVGLWLWPYFTMPKESMRPRLFMCSVGTPCRLRECSLIASITGCFLHSLMLLNFISSLQDTLTPHGSFIHLWLCGQSLSSAITNATWFCPVSEEPRKNRTNKKTHPRKEEFLMDGASTLCHVQTIFGRHWDG